MHMMYKAIIRAVFDNGCSAAKSILAKLKALRLCTGAFRTTLIPTLLVEAGEAPLRLQRAKLALNY